MQVCSGGYAQRCICRRSLAAAACDETSPSPKLRPCKKSNESRSTIEVRRTPVRALPGVYIRADVGWGCGHARVHVARQSTKCTQTCSTRVCARVCTRACVCVYVRTCVNKCTSTWESPAFAPPVVSLSLCLAKPCLSLSTFSLSLTCMYEGLVPA